MIQIQQVTTAQERDQFIGFAWDIYQGDPNWVPPLRLAVKDLLDVQKNPFFLHAEISLFLALNESGKIVGRIAGIIDLNHNKTHQESVVFFGFYESIDDPQVAKILLDTVVKWGKDRGMNKLMGPANPSSNHEWSALVEGFDDPAYVMMTYNPKYYLGLFDSYGLKKAKDLYAYVLDRKKSKFSERLMAQAERLKNKENIRFRHANMKDFDREVDLVLDIYNDAWEKNWGFVPMEKKEFYHLAKDMKMIMDPRLLLIAEVRGEPAGFALALPDANQAQIKVKDGKLFPTGLFKLLWTLKGPGRMGLERARVITLGIKQKFKLLGLGPLFYTEYLNQVPKLGYREVEASWILEDNIPMNRALELMGARRSKVYRVYEKQIIQ